MVTLPFLLFGLVFVTQLISWVGKSVLQELAFALYSRAFLSSSSSKQRALRKQVLEDKAELSRTSSQDEFAKWAKLKRKVDKGLADLERLNSTLSGAKTSFAVKFSSLIWISTTGAQLVLVWWYRKEPVFWLPQGWVPWPVAWLLSFPSAPLGAVSSAAWCTVCKRVLVTAEEVVKDLMLPTAEPVLAQPVPTQSTKGAAKEKPRVDLEHEKLD